MSATDSFFRPSMRSSQASLGNMRPDRTMMIGWSILALAALVLRFAVTIDDFSFDDIELPKSISILLLSGIFGRRLQFLGWTKIGLWAEISSQFIHSSIAAALGSIFLASTNFPLQDINLDAIDLRLLHCDWRFIIYIAEHYPKFMFILSYAYTTITWQPVILLLLFFMLKRFDLAKSFCLAWMAVLAISTAIFPFAPAIGGYLHHNISRSQTHVLVAAAWRHVEILKPVRDGSLRALNANTLEGIITFPSFHAAAAVLLAWGFWHLRYARWPALALNLAMLVSTPFVGGHYLIDVVFGCAIAALVLIAVARLRRECMGGAALQGSGSANVREQIG